MSSGSHLNSTSTSPDSSSVLLPRTYRYSEQFKKYSTLRNNVNSTQALLQGQIKENKHVTAA